ncbi:MAG TPA: division/cell wall cluster transcriptional repressor MraZ [Candidatus Binatia bacterium]|nr:division/cell wall cluster transcriptional repressor MraZ [Candidatus Binatia bacterium]
MFSGNYHHLIDSKGRVSVPSAFRDLVQVSGSSAVYLAPHPLSSPRFLEAYPLPAWQELQEKISKLPRFDPSVLKLEHFFLGQAHRCDFDNQGRMLVPPPLREWANLGKDVVFSGATDRFRLFDRQSWQQARDEAEAAFRADPALLSRLNL